MSESIKGAGRVIALESNMYNIIFGENELSALLLSLLYLYQPHMKVGRYRDCYLQRGGTAALEIHVYTRNGGGNRPDYEDVTARLREHPLYWRDFDDSFDTTYCSYVFKLAPTWVELLQGLVSEDPKRIPRSHRERAEAFVALSAREPNHPDVLRVAEAMRPALEQIAASMKEPVT